MTPRKLKFASASRIDASENPNKLLETINPEIEKEIDYKVFKKEKLQKK